MRNPMNTSTWKSQVMDLLGSISCNRCSNFSGTGIIFYRDLVNLPYLQLSAADEKPNLTQADSFDIASTLSSVSIMRSPYHDGFHFIDIEHWQISHLSQYISPPIPQGADKQLHGTGARLMSAMLASLLHGIVCVGLVSKEGKIYLFHSGIDIAREN
jgi:hypothetical protein